MELSGKIRERLQRLERESKPPLVHCGDGGRGAKAGEELAPLVLSVLSDRELEYKDCIHQQLLKAMDLTLLAAMEPILARQQVREVASKICEDMAIPLSAPAKLQVVRLIVDEVLGLGVLEPLLAEPTVSDILVNGCKRVYVERFGKLELTALRFSNDEALIAVIDRIVASVGRRIDESSPMVDARLKDGSRINAIIPPLAIDGPMLSIRRFSANRMSLEDLVAMKTLNQPMAQMLKLVVRSRLSILVSGGTGTGKTTMLNALSQYIPNSERILTIEDVAELQLRQGHVVRLETRPPNLEGKGEVTQRDLVKNALRMRPDRIILGEVRGEEVFDMLQAMNTGHDGSLTTVHANSPRDALARLENMMSLTGFDLTARSIRAQIASAINLVLHLERQEDGSRKVASIAEITGMEEDSIALSEIFRFEVEGGDDMGNIQGEHIATGIVPVFHERFARRGFGAEVCWYDPGYSEGHR